MKKNPLKLYTTLAGIALLLVLGAASAQAETPAADTSAPGTPAGMYASRHLPLQDTEGLLSLAIALGITGFLLAEQNALMRLYDALGMLGTRRPRERESGSRA